MQRSLNLINMQEGLLFDRRIDGGLNLYDTGSTIRLSALGKNILLFSSCVLHSNLKASINVFDGAAG